MKNSCEVGILGNTGRDKNIFAMISTDVVLRWLDRGFWVAVPFGFGRLVCHGERPGGGSIIAAVLERDGGFG